MKMKLTRLDITDFATYGRLTAGKFSCVTLEGNDVLIPVGTYKVSLYSSPKNKCQVPLIHVPGRAFIEIHVGNFVKDTQGCILVGKKRGITECIENSRKAFNELMAAIEKANDLEIEVV